MSSQVSHPSTLLHQMTLQTPTEFWSDSCETTSLANAIAQGATGATSNPIIVLEAIDANRPYWTDVLKRFQTDYPHETELMLAWRLVAQAAVEGADLLRPVYDREKRQRGFMSVQVNPQFFPNAELMIEQGIGLSALRENMAVKVPAVGAGIVAIEELTARGICINATVLFTLPQAIVVAEAMERGLARAKSAGIPTEHMTPWVTIMVGRLDDHLRDVAREQQIAIDPEHIRQASLATMRKAYRLFNERGYRAKLLSAAMRSHHHWSEFIGGNLVITIPPAWQHKFNDSGVAVVPRMTNEVDPVIIAELTDKFEDFRLAYTEGAIAPAHFARYGAAKKTLMQFLDGHDRLIKMVRESMIQN